MSGVTETSRAYRETIWYFDPSYPLAIRPGSFVEQLIRAMAHADPTNLRKLGLAFSDYAYAVSALKNRLDGYDHLADLVRALEVDDEPTA